MGFQAFGITNNAVIDNLDLTPLYTCTRRNGTSKSRAHIFVVLAIVPVYILTGEACECWFPHRLTNSVLLKLLNYTNLNVKKIVAHCSFDLHFSSYMKGQTLISVVKNNKGIINLLSRSTPKK